jgi:hypothetical protein
MRFESDARAAGVSTAFDISSSADEAVRTKRSRNAFVLSAWTQAKSDKISSNLFGD